MAYKQIKRRKRKNLQSNSVYCPQHTKISFYPQQCLLLPSIFLSSFYSQIQHSFFFCECTLEEFPHKESHCFHCVYRNLSMCVMMYMKRVKSFIASMKKKVIILLPLRKYPKWSGKSGVERKKVDYEERKKKVGTFSRFLCLPNCGEFLFSFMFEDFLMNDMKCKHFALLHFHWRKLFPLFLWKKIKSLFLSFLFFWKGFFTINFMCRRLFYFVACDYK